MDNLSTPASWCDVDDDRGDTLASALEERVRRGEALLVPLREGALETEPHDDTVAEIDDDIVPVSVFSVEIVRRPDEVPEAKADNESPTVTVTVALKTALADTSGETVNMDDFESVSVEKEDKVGAIETLALGDPLREDHAPSDEETEAVADAPNMEAVAPAAVEETDALAEIVRDANEVRDDEAAEDADDNADVDGVSVSRKDDDTLPEKVEDML